MNARPPGRVSLRWCPVCGRDDRYTDLKKGAGRHFADGKKCPGDPRDLEYVLPRVPEPLPSRHDGTFRAAVAVEVAVRPGLPHLDDSHMTFVGRTVQFGAHTVEQLAELAGLALRDIAQGLPDAMAPHPRPEPEGWMPR